MTNVPAGWYPDPDGKPSEKYWDGNNWTSDSRPQSFLPNRPGPFQTQKKIGMDSGEKGILIGIIVIIVIIALASAEF